MINQDRNSLRQVFFDAWSKAHQSQILTPLEQVIVAIIRLHPEYHPLLSNQNKNLHRDFTPEQGETNPFLHMSMHIAIHEQLTTQRPEGIVEIYQSLVNKSVDAHQAEHRIMECLGQMLWQAQLNNAEPDEVAYLECLKKLG